MRWLFHSHFFACVCTNAAGTEGFRLAMAVSWRSRFAEGKWARGRVVGRVTSTSDGSDDEQYGLAKRKKGGEEGGGAGGTAGERFLREARGAKKTQLNRGCT